jgi:homoserine kinase type II
MLSMSGNTASRLPLTEALLRSVLSSWELGAVHAIAPASGGATHHVYRVGAERGVFFLRIYRRPDAELAQREHALILHAGAAALPVLPPLVARHGSSVVENAGLVAALYPAAGGRQLRGAELGEVEARAAGRLLGELHRALASLRDTGYLHWTLSWDGAAWCERLNEVERVLLARPEPDETDRWALERLRAQRRWLADARCPHRHVPRAPAQVVHGDYQDANLFFEAGRVSAVIDWDQAAYLPRGYEIGRACSFMFRLDSALSRSFIAAYRGVNPIGESELEDGASGWGCFSDHHVWPLEETYLHGNDGARRYIPHTPFRPFREAWAAVWG